MAGEERCICLSGRGRKGIYRIHASGRSVFLVWVGGAWEWRYSRAIRNLRLEARPTCSRFRHLPDRPLVWTGHLVYSVRLFFLPFYSVQKKKNEKPNPTKKKQTLHLTNYGKIKPQISTGHGHALSLPGAPLPPCATTFPFSSNDLRKGAAQSLGLN